MNSHAIYRQIQGRCTPPPLPFTRLTFLEGLFLQILTAYHIYTFIKVNIQFMFKIIILLYTLTYKNVLKEGLLF